MKGVVIMKKIAIIYGELKNGVQKKAVEQLSKILLDYTVEYPVCFEYSDSKDYSDFLCIYIGTKENNPYIKMNSKAELSKAEEYAIKVSDGTVIIEGSDDAGVLYGCIDFYNKYIVKCEYTDDDSTFWVNPFENDTLPDFEYSSAPSVKDRGIWTWGHVIYDYKGFFDNMVKLKMNTVIIWNDFVPVNAKELIEYAHGINIKVIFGFSWLWDVDCAKADLKNLDKFSVEIFEKYEDEYAHLGLDGIYFQSFTELQTEEIGGVLIADAVTDFVNKTSQLFFDKYPDLELQFGLHATSVRNRLDYIKNVDNRVRIVWEDCGAFPFSYLPNNIKDFEDTCSLTEEIATLRGKSDCFGVVTKGLTKLDWRAFEHPQGPQLIGTSSKYMKENRIIRKRRIWRYLQAYWLTNADKAHEMTKLMADLKKGDLYITALVEDGMFEENIMFPVALFSEMMWDCNIDTNKMINEAALRNYVDFQ